MKLNDDEEYFSSKRRVGSDIAYERQRRKDWKKHIQL